MRVLQINSVCGIGSTGRIATDIHNILTEQGHESYIAYGRGEARNCDTSIKIGSNYDVYKHVALTRVFDKHGFGSKKATQEFLNKVERIDPDVIHLHNIHGYYINIELLFNYLKKSNKSVVWTLHDCWAFTGHCAHFDYAGCDKWKTYCYSCPQKKRYPSSILMDNSKNNYNKKKEIFTGVKNMTIVTPSKWLAGLVKQSFLKEYPVKVINNAINLNIFRPLSREKVRAKLGISKDQFIIIGVAASFTDERKGFKYFLELSKMIDDKCTIILVGVDKSQKEKLPKNIIGFSRTENIEELVEFYSTADVFLNPTLEDNFPTVNIESLACGIPVITFNTGGSIEIIDNNCGVIVEKGNINRLIQSINKVKVNKIDKNYCIKRAKKFDKKDRFNEYIGLYKEIVDEKTESV